MLDLKKRIIPAVLAVIGLLGLSYFTWGMVILLIFLTIGSYWEMYQMVRKIQPQWDPMYRVINIGAAVYVIYGVLLFAFPTTLSNLGWTPIHPSAPWIYLILIVLMFVSTWTKTLLPWVNIVYPGLGILSVVTLIFVDGNYNLQWLFMLLLCIWASDSFAYLGGSWIGGKKWAPRISPNKTISGWFCALLGVGLVSLIYNLLWIDWPWQKLALWIGLMWLSGTFGDLFESHLKRLANIKDSGLFLPGHGGFLDRLDSIIFSAPFAYLIIYHL